VAPGCQKFGNFYQIIVFICIKTLSVCSEGCVLVPAALP